MSSAIEVPRDLVEEIADLRLPESADRRLQYLMDRNTNGLLSSDEKEQLEALVEMSESLSLMRAKALRFLRRMPQ